MTRAALAIAALVALSGCDVLFPEDPRLGEESLEQCQSRIASGNRAFDGAEEAQALVVPTYTYDITKLGFEELQALIVAGSDETAGSREMTSTNEASTAVDNFMAQPVDENGAFFLGRDPALYRVRGEPKAVADVYAAGCEGQQANMRLIAVSIEAPAPSPAEDTPTENHSSAPSAQDEIKN